MRKKLKKWIVVWLAAALSVCIFSAGSSPIHATEISYLNYIYLESEMVSADTEQIVLASYGDEDTLISDAKLTVQNIETGKVSEYQMTAAVENAALFQMSFSGAECGIYEITDVYFMTSEGYEDWIRIVDTGIEDAMFGVYQGNGDADDAGLYTEGADSMLPLEQLQIVSLGSDPDRITSEAVRGISEALSAGEASPGAGDRLKTESTDYVVVLDPGHDISHAGASKNGIKEEALTLRIAQYCKEELEKYKHVTVYMTRYNASCPYPGTKSAADNRARVSAAANVGADLYVSIHLNSAETSRPYGATVYYPNGNYLPGIGSSGANLATGIQRQLTALGLKNNGIQTRNSGDGSKYPDGSLADYYAVIKYSKLSGFPAVIVEHAYVSNASDAAFLKDENNLEALGIADATGIAQYLDLSKESNIDRNKVYEFVGRLYQKCINRTSEEEGLEYWTDIICNEEQSGAEVAQGFFFSPEMELRKLSNAQFVETLYSVMMDRPAEDGGKKFWVSYLDGGVEREAIFKQFVDSPEYKAICDSYGIETGTVSVSGRNRSPGLTLFMMRLYTKAMNRECDLNGLDYWCNEILNGKYKILEVAGAQFFNSKEFINKKLSDEEYIKVLYRTFFDRECDKDGLNYWKAQMKKGMTRDEVLESFNNSPEFYEIRDSYGILNL